MIALLSINPPHVQNILSGVKIFEFRKKVFARRDIHKVLIYCTLPVGKLVGEFDIDTILEDSPARLWRQTKLGSGISKGFFDHYFRGKSRAFALRIGKVHAYKNQISPTELFSNFSPPQSFLYLRDKHLTALRELKCSCL